VTFKKNEKVVLDFDLRETPGNLNHATLYMSEGKIDGYLEDYTFIRWDDNGITINDEKGIFDEADIEIIEKEDGTLTLRFTMAFGSEVAESDVMLKVWNDKRHVAEIIYEDAFKVIESTDESELLSDEPLLQETQISAQELDSLDKARDELIESEAIPVWIKTSTGWWADGSIGDNDFAQGIQYMIKNDIIRIPNLPEYDVKTAQEKIPDWIKNIAGWWTNDQVSDKEFKQSLQWLIANGVMGN